MEYYCFVCHEKFAEVRQTFDHLKKIHLFRDNKNDLKCVIVSPPGYEQCTKVYKTFDSLRAHIKKCKPKLAEIDENIEVFQVLNLYIHGFHSDDGIFV